jgi:nucleoside-diphosphate-sugar epimerase
LKLLVIGGTGFFGKSILDSFQRGLLSKHNISNVIVLARNTNHLRRDFPELILDGVELLDEDISTAEKIAKADYIIHAASSTDKRRYAQNPEMEKDNIVQSVSNYVSLAMKYHKNASIVYCSSGAVYGKQPHSLEKIGEDYEFISLEDLPLEKRIYAQAKRKAEKLIQEMADGGMKVSIARCFAFYGKYLPKDQHFAYGNFIGQAENGCDIEVAATHPVFRSYMHADDLVDSLMILLKHASTECPVVNVGSDEVIEIRELAKKIAGKYGVSVKHPNEFNLELTDRYVPDIAKLKNMIK